MKKLPVLCPQEYDGMTMRAIECTRCSSGWDRKEKKCTIPTGVEHLSLDPNVPTCPMQERCQHQLQSSEPCQVRARGMICESALIWAGVPNAEDHPLAFHALMME